MSGPEADSIIQKAHDEELYLNIYSSDLHNLLPLMKVAPIFIAAKMNLGETGMFTKMSIGSLSSNDMVDISKV